MAKGKEGKRAVTFYAFLTTLGDGPLGKHKGHESAKQFSLFWGMVLIQEAGP